MERTVTTNRDAAIAMREAAAKACRDYAERLLHLVSRHDWPSPTDAAIDCAEEIDALPLPEVEPAQSVDMVTCGCGDMFPVGSYGHGFMGGAGHCANCVASAKQQVEPTCEWIEDLTWSGECGAVMPGVFRYERTPTTLGMRFCPGCGKPLVVKEKNDE